MFKSILKFIFTEDIRLHTMMNLLYDFLINHPKYDMLLDSKSNIIDFF